jgi:hypothetical protein
MCYLLLEEKKKENRNGMDKTLNFRKLGKTFSVPRWVESMEMSLKNMILVFPSI